MAVFVDESYLARLNEDQLRNELRWELERTMALSEAFKTLPEVPHTYALHLLSEWATWPRDWAKGKQMQREHGLDKIPPNSECENGAGLWSILRAALIAAKTNAE